MRDPGIERRPALSSVVLEIGDGLLDVMRGEIHLAKAEMRQAANEAKREAMQLAAFGVFAGLGIFPFLAFLCIGLGRLLDDNYWLSSLIVTVVLVGVGVAVAIRSMARLQADTARLTLPKARKHLEEEREDLNHKFAEVSHIHRRRNQPLAGGSKP